MVETGGDHELGLDKISSNESIDDCDDDEDRGDEHTFVQEGTSGREGSWGGRLVSTTSASKSLSAISLNSGPLKPPLLQMLWPAHTPGLLGPLVTSLGRM